MKKNDALCGLLLAIAALTISGCYSHSAKKPGSHYYISATITDINYIEPRRPSGQTVILYTLKTHGHSQTYTYRAVHGPQTPMLDKISRKVVLKMEVAENGSSVVAEMEFLP